MTSLQRLALLSTITLALAGGASAQNQAPAPPQPATAAPASNGDLGRKLFVSYGCYQCHGLEAQGSSATGPRLGPRPLPFAAFARYVRQPSNQMPPYTTKVASDVDLAHIYAFVLSRPAPASGVPLLK